LKKEAKTFAPCQAWYCESNALIAKVFWFFFSKKNSLLHTLLPMAGALHHPCPVACASLQTPPYPP
jgi:hypothetical protein